MNREGNVPLTIVFLSLAILGCWKVAELLVWCILHIRFVYV